MKKILIVAGTRPEIIKLAPVLLTAREKYADFLDVKLSLTGQHRTMGEQAMTMFSIKADFNLNIMRAGQTLNQISEGIFKKLPAVIEDFSPDLVMVQGDTTTAAMSAITAFQMRVPVAHVESGLRTFRLEAPYPEEMNRKLISAFAEYCFAPTENAAKNLRNEGVDEKRVFVTGNTVVDALEIIRKKFDLNLESTFRNLINQPYILMTAHRRESFGGGLKNICTAVMKSAEKHKSYSFVYPVHLNPNVEKPVKALIGNIGNVILMPPVSYIELLTLLKNSEFCITDSGGIQEEAPSFGKRTIVLREVTERIESVASGLSVLVGTNELEITKNIDDYIKNASITHHENPFGDGKAANRICRICKDNL